MSYTRFLSAPLLVKVSVWYFKSPSSQFHVPDMHSVAILTSKSSVCRVRNLTRRMSLHYSHVYIILTLQ